MQLGDQRAADDLAAAIALFSVLTKDDGLLPRIDALLRRQAERQQEQPFDPVAFAPVAPRETSQAELDAISALVNMKVPKAAATSVVHRIAGEMATATGAQPEFDPLFRKSLAAVKQL